MENYTIIALILLGIGLAIYLSWSHRRKEDDRFKHVFEENKE